MVGRSRWWGDLGGGKAKVVGRPRWWGGQGGGEV